MIVSKRTSNARVLRLFLVMYVCLNTSWRRRCFYKLLERHEGEMVPDVMSRELVKRAKRTSYDAETRRLTFIMPDQAAAASWHPKTILFRGKRLQKMLPATPERDDITTLLLLW